MNKMDLINQFVSLDNLALAGISKTEQKFGNAILKTLSTKGYNVFPVHPELKVKYDYNCYSDIYSLPEQVEGIIITVRPDTAIEIIKDAFKKGIKNIWLQQGSESDEAIKFCNENGINLVSKECILMFASPKGFHSFHRWIWKTFKLMKN